MTVRPEFINRAFRWFFGTLSAAMIVGGLFMVMPAYNRSQELKRKSAALSERIEEKKREIAQLNEYQRRFKSDPDFVESIARQNRRVFPGELVFVFKDNP